MTETRTALQGPAIRTILADHGIDASSITRNRRTGVYTVKFNGNLSSFYGAGTKTAREWADAIQVALPLADIIDGFENRADWRPGNPVLFATVMFVLPQTQNARQTEVQQAS